nr:3-hydroxybenzoate 6-hydroxylase 1 [Quercus suber]
MRVSHTVAHVRKSTPHWKVGSDGTVGQAYKSAESSLRTALVYCWGARQNPVLTIAGDIAIILVAKHFISICRALFVSRRKSNILLIFEKSQFIGEVGAAFALSPNGVKVLRSVGFSFERARAQPIQVWDVVDSLDLHTLDKMDLSNAEEAFGAPVFSVHRVDMHNELLRTAEQLYEQSSAVEIHLASRVISGNALEGYIDLEDGARHYADLIIAADGVHSVLRPLVIEKEIEPLPTGFGAFRFLIPTTKFLDDPRLSQTLGRKSPGSTIFTNNKDQVPERHMVCKGKPLTLDGRAADHVSCWPLYNYAPLPRWAQGKMLLIGDAAHPVRTEDQSKDQ